MPNHLIQSHLDTIDAHLDQVSRCLLDPGSGDLVHASANLQAAVVALSRLPQMSAVEPQLKLRMRHMMASFDACREALMRRRFLTESLLGTLIPATRNHTYAPATGRFTRQPYGSAGRQSGEFQVISA